MGLMDRATDRVMDKAMEKMDSRFMELRDILQQMLGELRTMNAKLSPVSPDEPPL